MRYYFSRKIKGGFEEAVDRVTEALKAEGFGILTQINVHEVMEAKLGVKMSPYRILGACNPPFAHKALELENKIGLMLPCNVVVQQLSEGEVEISAVDPIASMQAVENPKLAEVADAVRGKLQAVMEAL